MSNIETKLDKLAEDVVELKLAFVKQEANYEKAIEILERLTESVVEHVRRSDNIEELVKLNKASVELELVSLQAELEKKKSNDRMIWLTLCAVGVIILGLHQLGILTRLF